MEWIMQTRYTNAHNSYIYFYPTEKEDSVGKKSSLHGMLIILLLLFSSMAKRIRKRRGGEK
jgi:ATP-dependent helicase/DNAse subunit B